MPTTADIERLEALLDRLVPLSDKQRGELVASDDWNTMVGALIEIGRAALTAGVAEAAPPHEHTDQVGIGWLDPRVRQLVTGGGVRDPGVETAFVKLRRDLAALTTRLDRIGADVDRSRLRLDTIAVNDVTRETMLNRLNRKVLGAADDRGDIADLRGTLRTLQTEVGRAVEVGSLLERNGQTIDVPGLVDRVSAVEELRARLTGPNGEELDAARLEIRLQELQAGFVSEADLRDAIEDVRTDIGGGIDRGVLIDEARLAGREAAGDAVGTLGTQLRSELADRFEGVRTLVDEQVAVVTAGLQDQVLAAARSELAAAVQSGDAAVRADLTGILEARVDALGRLVDERLSGVGELVGTTVARELERELGDALGEVADQIGELESGLGLIAGRVGAAETSIAETGVRLEATRREEAATRAQLRGELLDRIAGVESQIGPRVGTAVDEARATLRTDLEATVGAARRDLETKLTQVARQAAETEVKILATQIRTDVGSVVRQQIDADLAVVRRELASEVAGLNQRVEGMVGNAVTRATAAIPQLVTNEVSAFRPELIRLIDDRIRKRPPIDPILPIDPLRPIDPPIGPVG